MIDRFTLHLGDCREVLAALPDASIDAVVTDPPYGLGKAPDALAMLRDWLDTGHYDVKGRGFMGREWDAFVPQPVLWHEVYRVMKPGAHLVAFAGTRTQDLMGLALRIAGFEIRDCLSWLYGTGFPKSLDISKAIDKEAGAIREVVGRATGRAATPKHDIRGGRYADGTSRTIDLSDITAPATDAARQWEGWGTALKPAYEPIILARKPLIGTVAANVQAHGTGGINIDACRIGALTGQRLESATPLTPREQEVGAQGRWPSNVLLDEVAAMLLDESTGELVTGAWNGFRNTPKTGGVYGEFAQVGDTKRARPADIGGASRFFYTSKASSAERLAYLTCDCETVKLESWKPHTNPVAGTSPQKATSAEPSTGDCDSSISLSGSATTARSAQARASTTSTTTSATTESKILPPSIAPRTSDFTQGVTSKAPSGGNLVEDAASKNPSTQSTGTSAPRGGRFTGVVVDATSPLLSRPSRCGDCGAMVRRDGHPTQKPVDLMRWLVRLVTPPGGIVLDPFMGSGSTGVACMNERFRFIGVEREAEYHAIALKRLEAATRQGWLDL